MRGTRFLKKAGSPTPPAKTFSEAVKRGSNHQCLGAVRKETMAWSQVMSLITRNVGLMRLRCFGRPPHGPTFLSISLNGTQVGMRLSPC